MTHISNSEMTETVSNEQAFEDILALANAHNLRLSVGFILVAPNHLGEMNVIKLNLDLPDVKAILQRVIDNTTESDEVNPL